LKRKVTVNATVALIRPIVRQMSSMLIS